MRSPGLSLARVANKTAVPYVSVRTSLASAFSAPTPMVREMQSMGSVGTLFAIVTKLANATSQVEWQMWRKSTDGKPESRTQVKTHAALNLLNKPNAFFTRQELIEVGQQHMELTGETWWVISRSPRSRLPLELWPVRPDKMMPVPDADDFISGYIYTGPDGQQIPLDRDQVIMMRAPNPLDPYRGMGPVQTILPDLSASAMAAQYIANFFTNSAEPGGIIEVDQRMSDPEFDEMTSRWREQHQGVANAHRVAVIEKGHWVDRKYTMKDMQFTELRAATSETIREAFGFPKPMLGTTDDVNRANAEAAEYVFAKWLIVPRLNRMKQALNNDLLPLFYPPGATPDVEFDYVDPVPENEELEAAERLGKAETAQIYITLGFDPDAVLDLLDVPTMPYTKPAVSEPPADDPPLSSVKPVPSNVVNRSTRHRTWPTGKSKLDSRPDLTHVQESWQRHLDELLATWVGIRAAQSAALVAMVRDIVSSGTQADLMRLSTDSSAGASALLQAMVLCGAEAAEHAAAEVTEQGGRANAVNPTQHSLTAYAIACAALLAEGLAYSAAHETLRIWGQYATADTVGPRVLEYLTGLSQAQEKLLLGAALTMAQRMGRVATLVLAPDTDLFASEVLDAITCDPCAKIDGTGFGSGMAAMTNIDRLYPTGGYVDCKGHERCRGQVVAVVRKGSA